MQNTATAIIASVAAAIVVVVVAIYNLQLPVHV